MKLRPKEWILLILTALGIAITNPAWALFCEQLDIALTKVLKEKLPGKTAEISDQLAQAGKRLRNDHHVIFPANANPMKSIDTEELKAGYNSVFTQAPPEAGQRIFVSIPSSPNPNNGINIMHLSESTTAKIEEWAQDVLATAQAAFPNEKLRIGKVSVGRGFNAAGSLMHVDGASTYLHATSTLKGPSTVVIKKEVLGKLKDTHPGVAWRLVEKGPDGKYVAEAFQGSNKYERVTLSIDDVIEPETGSTVFITGRDRIDAVAADGTYHASPLMNDVEDEERITVFLGIEVVP